jgi:peroxiredoxin (alkyl hydroperoxide reductase subunit C)
MGTPKVYYQLTGVAVMKFMLAVMVFFIAACSRTDVPAGSQARAVPPDGVQSLLGSPLPSMRLDAYHRGAITAIDLKSHAGRWVALFFYPSDFTIVCPTELKELADYYDEFVSLGAELLSVSTDSVHVHQAWVRHTESLRGVRFPMLSDRSGALSRALGCYNHERGFSERATFLVDPEGRVVAYEFHHESIGRSADELLRKLSAAQAVRAGGGGYCPAGWKPGDEVLPRK